MDRQVKLLTTKGRGSFEEVEWTKPHVGTHEIEVQAVMTGVCRSDIDMMNGQFNLPKEMHGHEGLGIVTEVGQNIYDVKVGDYVATRGEPAYADYYNAAYGTYVQVPELHQKYIVEPIACGINVFRRIMRNGGLDGRICIIGTGFLSSVVYANLKLRHVENVEIIGRYNRDFWQNQFGVEVKPMLEGKYDVVVDLSNNDLSLTTDIYKPNALLAFASTKHPEVTSNFNYLLWNAVTMVCPSPRNPDFHDCMLEAVSQIETGKLNVDNFWTKGYDRQTEWRNAFSDSVLRPQGFNRAFIKW